MVNTRILLIVSYVKYAIVSYIFDEHSHRKDVIDHLEAIKLLTIGKQADLVCSIQINDLMWH